MCVCVRAFQPCMWLTSAPFIRLLLTCSFSLCHHPIYYSLVWNRTGVPSTACHMSTLSYCTCSLSHHALFNVLALHVPFFPPSIPVLIFIKRQMFVAQSSFDCQAIYWINNLSNQSQWHSSKRSKPAWNSTDRARGTARMLLRWPTMSMAAAQLSCNSYLRSPSPTHTHPTTTYSNNHVSVQQQGNFFFYHGKKFDSAIQQYLYDFSNLMSYICVLKKCALNRGR